MPRKPTQDSELLREIRRRRAEMSAAPRRSLLLAVLDSLNTMDVLARWNPPGQQTYGPRSFTGQDWAGAVCWAKGTDYHAYKTLTLIGLWARQTDDTVELLVGKKTLSFSAAFYSAEAYHAAIQHDFRPYYAGDAAPPQPAADVILWRDTYSAAQRLALRRAVAVAVTAAVET